MKLPRVQFTVRSLMALVLALALLLAMFRVATRYIPRAHACWTLAAREDQLSQAYHDAALRYRSCGQVVPCAPSEYCFNSCLVHTSAPGVVHPPSSDSSRARTAAAEHRQAAEDHEHAAALHAARASFYRRAMFRVSQPLPDWPHAAATTVDVFERYQCDSY